MAYAPFISPLFPLRNAIWWQPLAVHPAVQRQGIGTDLIAAGLEHLQGLQVGLAFVYGGPRYYGRFGFRAGLAADYTPPCELTYPFGWQAKSLKRVRPLPVAGPLICVQPLSDPQLW